MYANVNSGQRQLFVSLLMTASVAALRCTKNTISDNATGMLNTGISVPSQVAAQLRLEFCLSRFFFKIDVAQVVDHAQSPQHDLAETTQSPRIRPANPIPEA